MLFLCSIYILSSNLYSASPALSFSISLSHCSMSLSLSLNLDLYFSLFPPHSLWLSLSLPLSYLPSFFSGRMAGWINGETPQSACSLCQGFAPGREYGTFSAKKNVSPSCMSWSIGKDLKLRRPPSRNSLLEKATLNPKLVLTCPIFFRFSISSLSNQYR